ncbi:MAG: hypothetical protein QXU89_04020 [Desulfurococcaceae archaeon]
MYSIVLITLSIITSLIWFKNRDSRLRLDILALITGSSGLMFLIDNIFSYLEEGVFIETSTDTLILTVILVLFAIILWIAVLLIKSMKYLKH